MFSRLQTFLLSLGAFLRPKKWNCVCSVDVSATISVCEWCTPLLMKVSTPKHKKVNKKYLPHKFRSFFLAQHFCLFFAFKHTLSPPLYLHHNRHYIASRFNHPPSPIRHSILKSLGRVMKQESLQKRPFTQNYTRSPDFSRQKRKIVFYRFFYLLLRHGFFIKRSQFNVFLNQKIFSDIFM